MAQATAKKPKAPAKRESAARTPPTSADVKDAIDRAADLSDDVLASLEAGQRAALKAVRKFTDTVDEALPALGDRPTRRERIVDAALDMADELVETQYRFLRSVVRSTDTSLTGAAEDKAKAGSKS